MSATPLRIFLTPEFEAWHDSLDTCARKQLRGRLSSLACGHLGDSRSLGDGLFELRWKNGMRVYYTRKRVGEIDTFVLYGGFKRTQFADIKKARRIQTRYE